MPNIDLELATNKRAWDQIAQKFSGHCALPDWGPFGEARSIDLLGNLNGLTVLEVGCGSGHSIARVAERGAKRIYGIDISTTQLVLAKEQNRGYVDAGVVHLLEAPMERALDIRDVDVIFSIYAIGWTLDIASTFCNFAAYLKPGGRLIWSWGHPLFPEVRCVNGYFVLPESYSYFSEQQHFAANWCGSDGAVIQRRKLSSWIHHLTEAGFVISELLEPEAEYCPEQVFNNNRLIPMVKAQMLPTTVIFVCHKP